MWVTLVRHGKTDWNDTGRFQGHSDIPLNEKGLEQARVVAQTLAQEEFDVVVSSDLIRCRETAEIICEGKNVSIVCDARWREMDFGPGEGLTWEEQVARGIENIGEDPQTMSDRVCEAVEELCERGCDNALIVTHSGPIYAFITNYIKNGGELIAKERPTGSIFQAYCISRLKSQ